MLAEFAIGYATLVGVLPIFSALMSALMSLGLFLASSFYVRPYFLGSDLPYMLLWVLYALNLLNLKEPISEINSQKVKSAKYPTRRSILKVSSVALLTIFTPFIGKFLTPGEKVKTKTSGKVAKEIIKVANLAVGDSLAFTSKTGSPAILFRSKVGVFAYSAVCTHQGCTVAYEPFSKSLQCPCHGAGFDPFDQGKVLGGPAPRPLDNIKVTIVGESVVEI